MSQIKSTFTGSVVADPRFETTPNGASKMTFPVYVNHAKKNKDTGQFVKTGDVSKIRVTLWGDKTALEINKGDLVVVTATLVEKRWTSKDGSPGQGLQTDWVESVEVKFANTHPLAAVPAVGAGFDDAWAEPPADEWSVATVGEDEVPF